MLTDQEEATLFATHGTETNNREERIKVDVLPPGLHYVTKPYADMRQDHHARYELSFRDATNRLWLREANGTLHRVVGPSRLLGNYDGNSIPLRSTPLES